jgi:hypothetical protein
VIFQSSLGRGFVAPLRGVVEASGPEIASLEQWLEHRQDEFASAEFSELDFPRLRRHSEGEFFGQFRKPLNLRAKMDSVYVFYSGRDHHVTHVTLARFLDQQKDETQRAPVEHSVRPPAREESPLRSSIGQLDLTTKNPRTSRKHENIRGLRWSTRPDSNWRPSRWQGDARLDFIKEFRLERSYRYVSVNSGGRLG